MVNLPFGGIKTSRHLAERRTDAIPRRSGKPKITLCSICGEHAFKIEQETRHAMCREHFIERLFEKKRHYQELVAQQDRELYILLADKPPPF